MAHRGNHQRLGHGFATKKRNHTLASKAISRTMPRKASAVHLQIAAKPSRLGRSAWAVNDRSRETVGGFPPKSLVELERMRFDGRKDMIHTSAEHAAFEEKLDPPDAKTH